MTTCSREKKKKKKKKNIYIYIYICNIYIRNDKCLIYPLNCKTCGNHKTDVRKNESGNMENVRQKFSQSHFL